MVSIYFFSWLPGVIIVMLWTRLRVGMVSSRTIFGEMFVLSMNSLLMDVCVLIVPLFVGGFSSDRVPYALSRSAPLAASPSPNQVLTHTARRALVRVSFTLEIEDDIGCVSGLIE